MKKKNKEALPRGFMIGPAMAWLALFLLLPLGYIVVISFLQKNAYGGVILHFSLASYRSLLHAAYLKVFAESFLLAFETTVLCLLVGYPMAYIIAKSPEHLRAVYDAAVLDQFDDPDLRLEHPAAEPGGHQLDPDPSGGHFPAVRDALYGRDRAFGHGL